MFDKLITKFIFEGDIVATTAIHIGDGKNGFKPNAVDDTVMKNKEGLPFIPASSLKGVLRSYLERVLASIGREVCVVNKCCDERFESKEKRKNFSDEDIYNEVCEICHLFGSGVNGAKFSIRDLKVIEETFAGYEYRSGNAIDRDTNKTADGALYDFEIVPADTRFKFKAILENPDSKDINNVVFLLKSMEEEELLIGGKTSRGLGGFKLENLKIQYIDANNIMDTYLNNKKEYISVDDMRNKVSKGDE